MTNKQEILVVEDEQSISNFICAILHSHDYLPISAMTGKEAMALLSGRVPELMILDLGLPDMDGLEIIRQVRQWSQLPIIVVSARDREKEKVAALDLGADDYIVKPFGISELLARIRTALRRMEHLSNSPLVVEEILRVRDLVIDPGKRTVTVAGLAIHLTQIEFKIISLLAKYPGKVLTHDFIIKNIWGPYAGGDNQILRVNMANIRRKLEENPGEPHYIITELGVGYRLADE